MTYQLEGNITLEDFKKFKNLSLGKNFKVITIIFYAVIVFMCIPAIIDLIKGTKDFTYFLSQVSFYIVVVVFVLIMFRVYRPYSIKKLYNKTPSLQERIYLTITEEKIVKKTETTDVSLEKNSLLGMKTGESAFYLYINLSSVLLIPYSFFSSKEEQDAVGLLIKENFIKQK